MVSDAITSRMDRIFHILLGFSKELNTMLGLSELFITASEPEVAKRITNNPASRVTCLHSNIATTLFRLLIEGKKDTISFYLVPTDILSLNEVSLRYSALSIWKAHFGPQGQVIWESPAGILTDEMLNAACLDLIRNLVDATLGASTPEKTVPNHDLTVGCSEAVPCLPERTEHTAKQTISFDGTRTDSVPSLAALQSTIFETTGEDTPSKKSLIEQEQFSETVVETYELAKPEPTWQPVCREQTDSGRPDFPSPLEQQDQIVPKVAKQTDFGKPNFSWQREQQDKIAPKVARQTDLGKPDFPWQREQQEKIAPKVASSGDFGKPNFPWQHEVKDQIVSGVAKPGDFGKPNFPWQHEQKDQIVPGVASPGDFGKPNLPWQQNQVVPVAATERASPDEPRLSSQQDEITPETVVESLEGKMKVSSFGQEKEVRADIEKRDTSKKGVTSKRLTRKTNTRRNRKKRNQK